MPALRQPSSDKITAQGNTPFSAPLVFFCGLLLASFAWAYWPIIQALVTTWSENEDYSHGFFIVPVACYLIWQKKSKSPIASSGFNWIAALTIIACSLLYLAGLFSQFRTLGNLSLVLTIWASVIFLFGFRFFRANAWELVLLLFMLPIPSRWYASITLPLQLLVTKISYFVLQLMGIPVLREGNILHLSNTSLEVVNACSGLRSILTIIVLAYILSCFLFRSPIKRVALIVAAIPCAIFTNLIRVSFIAYFAEQGNVTFIEGTSHTILGLVLFVLSFLLLTGCGKGILWLFPEK